MTLMTGGAPVEQPGRAVVRDGVGGQRVEDCCLHDEQVGGGASGDDDLMMRMIIMAMMTMRIIMMMTPKTELGCAAASREKERTGRAREQQVELGGVMVMIMIITPWRWRNYDDDGGDYDDTWEGGRSGERELGSSLRSLESDLFLENWRTASPWRGGGRRRGRQ